MNRDDFRKLLIFSFFEQLASEYNYAILHHIEDIFNASSDIDFIVDTDVNKILYFVKNFTKSNNLIMSNFYSIDKYTYRFDLNYFDNNSMCNIELDCVCNSNGQDLLQINVQELISNRFIYNVGKYSFYKISNTDEINYYIKKKIFKRTDISLYNDYLINLSSNSLSKEEIEQKNILWNTYFNSLPYKIKHISNKFLLLIKRIQERPAINICFLGPDGSGKSTIIDNLIIQPFFIYKFYFHLKPIKPSKIQSSNTIVTDPHQYPPYSPIKSIIKLLYFILQYNMGWIKNILPLQIKSSLIIFDRYYDDLLVDTRRYRYGASLSLARFARFFVPKPDLYFILTTDAEVIHARKQEVPYAELERQIFSYRALADGKGYFNIDVNRTPEEIVREITTIIMEKMNERY